jgi:hypothetical protein
LVYCAKKNLATLERSLKRGFQLFYAERAFCSSEKCVAAESHRKIVGGKKNFFSLFVAFSAGI